MSIALPVIELNTLFMRLPAFGLVVLRLGGLMLTAPYFGGVGVPTRIKALLVGAMALALFPIVEPKIPDSVGTLALVSGALGELMIGMVIGLALAMPLIGLQLGGMMVGQQAGFALARVFDPSSGNETSLFSQFFLMLMTVVFLVSGGHRALIVALIDTFERVPPLMLWFDYGLVDLLIALLTSVFIVAVKVAAPALACLFLITLSMGFVARTMPQLNILSVGFTIRIAAALAISAAALTAAAAVYNGFVDLAFDRVDQLW